MIEESISQAFTECNTAAEYAAIGVPVFPCASKPTWVGGKEKEPKRPLTMHGFKDATTDENQIRAWWQTWPDAAIGMPTGATSGYVVLDVDTYKPEGAASYRVLQKLGIPGTLTSRTGSDGLQFFFRHPGAKVTNTAGKPWPGVDIRGDGGYVILPPSRNKNGRYEWINKAEAAEMPDWLKQAVMPTQTAGAATKKRTDRPTTGKDITDEFLGGIGGRSYAEAALEDECAKLAAMKPNSGRNNALNAAACKLGNFVAGGELDRATVEARLFDAACACGLDKDEGCGPGGIRRTIESGLTEGMKYPRKAPAKPAPTPAGASRADLPVVKVRTGHERDAVEQVWSILQKTGVHFMRGGGLVRVVGGDIRLCNSRDVIFAELVRHMRFEKFSKKDGGWIAAACPDSLPRLIRGDLRSDILPELDAVATAPFLDIRKDRLVCRPGYDPDTRTFLSPTTGDFPPLPDKPTMDDVQRACDVLWTPYKDFPFVDASNRGVWLAAVLTTTIRPQLLTAPAFGLDAPKASHGKTLLAKTLRVLAGDKTGELTSGNSDETETPKRLISALATGQRVIIFDNVDRPIDDPALCAVLTTSHYADRLLGTNTIASYPVNNVFIFTGNNLVVRGDMVRRLFISRLDAQTEEPESREFDLKPLEWCADHRLEMLHAAAVIIRHALQNRPAMRGTVGSFEMWNDVVRAAVVLVRDVLDVDDPIEVIRAAREADESMLSHARFLDALAGAFGDRPFSVSDVCQQAEIVGNTRQPNDLRAAALEIAGDRTGAIQPRKVAWHLRRYKGTIAGGKRVVKAGFDRNKNSLWRVEGNGVVGKPELRIVPPRTQEEDEWKV